MENMPDAKKIYIKISEFDETSNGLIVQIGSDVVDTNIDENWRLFFRPHIDFPSANNTEKILKNIAFVGLVDIERKITEKRQELKDSQAFPEKEDIIKELAYSYHEFDVDEIKNFIASQEREKTGHIVNEVVDKLNLEDL